MRDPALPLFSDPEEFGPLSATSVQRLRERGVAIEDIVSPWPIGSARVAFDPDEPLYRPKLLGQPAFIFGVLGENGLVDAAAWRPTDNRIACRLGNGAALGEAQIGRDGLGSTGLPIPVWRSPIGWLRAGRTGIVIVDPVLAAHRLAGMMLAGEDAAHNAELRARLAVPPPAFTLAREARPHAVAA